ncbi:hypothetical protein ACEQ8H_004565 [Pleosporales sp. CAS-2024a]
MSEAVTQGPYGPDNPPPPPAESPPDKRIRKRGHKDGDKDRLPPSSTQEDAGEATRVPHSFLYKKLNSRQRKKFLQSQQKAFKERDRERSRSPTASRRRGSQSTYRDRSALRHDHDGNKFGRPGSGGSRLNLQDARQRTPDQIMDETAGRLSPAGLDDGERYDAGNQPDLRWTKRTDWPDSRPRSPQVSPRDMEIDSYRPEYRRGQSKAPRCGRARRGGRARSNASFKRAYQHRQDVAEKEAEWRVDGMMHQAKSENTCHAPDRPSGSRPLEGAAYQNSNTYEPEPNKRFGPYEWDPEPAKEPSGARWQANEEGTWNSPEAYTIPDTVVGELRTPADGRHNLGARRMERLPTQYYPASESFEHDAAQHGPFSGGGGGGVMMPEAAAPMHVPDTVLDLRHYDEHITKLHDSLPRHLAYRNGNGKAAPHAYGSTQEHDLGLCFVTFLTDGWCEMGSQCAWRHHPLTRVEREWIASIGKPRSREFLDQLPRRWSMPEVPVPGASMNDKAQF